MENMYEILSDNLVRLRKSRNLTQAELADILKYSDKSISKWETGEALPNLETLVHISDFYGITVDELLRGPIDTEKFDQVEKIRQTNKLVIAILAITAVWLVAVIIFVLGLIRGGSPSLWKAFVWAVPFSFTIAVVFSSIWNPKYVYFLVSCFIWTILAAIYINFLAKNYYMIFFIGVPLQIIVFLSRGLKYDAAEVQAKRQAALQKKKEEKIKKQNHSKEET